MQDMPEPVALFEPVGILAALLFTVCFGGLAYVFLRAMLSGAQAYSGAFSEDTARQFEDIFLFIPARRIAEIGWAMAMALFMATFFFIAGDFASMNSIIVGLLVASPAAMLGLFMPRWTLSFLKQRRRRKFNLQLVDTLVSMSNALKAGFSITQTFETIVKDGENPIAQEFDMFLQQTRMGVNFSDALTQLEQRVGSDDMTLVAMAIETARKTGGNLTEIFEKISATIRERIRIENRIRTLTAQGRLQGLVVGAMPLIIGIALTLVDPRTMMPFFHSPFGMGIIVGALVLVTCGGLLIRKIVNIDV